MKKFRELMDGGKTAGRSQRVLSFQALANNLKKDEGPAANFAELQHKVKQKTLKEPSMRFGGRYQQQPPQPSTTITNPFGNMIRPRKQTV